MGRGLQSKANRSQNRAIAAGRSTRGSSRASVADIQNHGAKGKRKTKGCQNATYYGKNIRYDDKNYTIEYRFENEHLHIGNVYNYGSLREWQCLTNATTLKSKIIRDNNLKRLLAHKLIITLRVEQAQAQS